ncbi:hypothetical protein [Rugosimonospora africana]|uniref:hypothetical protein n=1 Tax=Rugosimonospora africana TaxID=556532 RepID=UPI0027E4D401|nr:hypothetical protein [Rugosimonospora africana]
MGEHRSDPITVDLSGLARALLTRVQVANGAQHADIRVRLALHPNERLARQQLRTLLAGLDEVLGRAAMTVPPRTTGRRAA